VSEFDLDAVQAAARRHETPCGAGAMVWHEWGAPTAPPVLLLHGGAGSWRHWARNIPALSRHRRLLVPDLPGLGDSALPPEGIGFPQYSAIVTAGFRALAGDGPYDLVGFSFGAINAGRIAAEAPAGQLRSVTLVGAGGLGLPAISFRLASVRAKQGAERVAAHRSNLAMLMLADPARIDPLALRIQAWNSDHARLRSRNLVPAGTLRDALPGIRAPLAMIYGERDAIAFPFMDQRAAMLRAAQPDAAFHVVPGAGHWVQFEAAAAVDALLLERLGNGEGC
jgi:pimeloyl-ACP methyl ester carboxylesterase